MPKTIIKIKTWTCPSCGYHQDFEPTPQLMSQNFSCQDNSCPSCKTSELLLGTDDSRKIAHTVLGDEDIDAEILILCDKLVENGSEEMTANEKAEYKTKRQGDVARAIAEAKKHEDK